MKRGGTDATVIRAHLTYMFDFLRYAYNTVLLSVFPTVNFLIFLKNVLSFESHLIQMRFFGFFDFL